MLPTILIKIVKIECNTPVESNMKTGNMNFDNIVNIGWKI